MDNNYCKNPEGDAAFERTEVTKLMNDDALLREAKQLLKEYGEYMYIELGLIAGKERFFKDLEHFPASEYFGPSGVFVLASVGHVLCGCVGIRKFDEYSCEMKRMYIRSAYRGKGIGMLLCRYVINWCKASVYTRILLDTNAEMKEAVSLYRKCGFREIAPYCINENEQPLFMEYTY
jgi:GNAT superfamily N-acetyltransferase